MRYWISDEPALPGAAKGQTDRHAPYIFHRVSCRTDVAQSDLAAVRLSDANRGPCADKILH